MLKRFIKTKLIKLLLSEKEQISLSLCNGYLNDIGWFNSFIKKEPVDVNNNFLPWVTYPYIDFIENRLQTCMEIFEFGSGNSTLYYSSKVKSVMTVEHDIEWFDKMKSRIPQNVLLSYKKMAYGGDYCKTAKESNNLFDIIIIDGRDRVNCMLNSVNSLKKGGIIILDDSERTEYVDGINFLISNGFKKIDFWGISQGATNKKNTTIFYKDENCLKI
jgi:hypothetical protein